MLDELDEWAENRTERKEITERLHKPVKVISVTIFSDLSSEIRFGEDDFFNIPFEDLDDPFYIMLDKNGGVSIESCGNRKNEKIAYPSF